MKAKTSETWGERGVHSRPFDVCVGKALQHSWAVFRKQLKFLVWEKKEARKDIGKGGSWVSLWKILFHFIVDLKIHCICNTHTHINTHTHMYLHTHTYTHKYTDIPPHTHTHKHIHIRIHTHSHTHLPQTDRQAHTHTH